MIDGGVQPGDVIRATYYAVGERRTKRGAEVHELVEKTGNFVVISTTNRYVYGLMSLRNNGNILEPNHCFIYNDSYYVILKLKYHIKIENITKIIYHMGQTEQFTAICETFSKFSEDHLVREVGDKKKVTMGGFIPNNRNAFHMAYSPSTSVRTVGAGSFRKK